MSRKLKKGIQVVANGRTYKDEVPEEVVKSLKLGDKQLEPIKENKESVQTKK